MDFPFECGRNESHVRSGRRRLGLGIQRQDTLDKVELRDRGYRKSKETPPWKIKDEGEQPIAELRIALLIAS